MKKRPFRPSGRLLLYIYFLGFIALGTFLLSLPVSWSGETLKAPLTDAFFTAVSAVCVTGLITVDTASWSAFGQLVLLLLIQIGGLGIITFGTLYLILPHSRVSLKNSQFIRNSFAPEGTVGVKNLVRDILGTTLLIEGLGALVLTAAFAREGSVRPFMDGVFHAVSAFCNAGFSRFTGGLTAFRNNVVINVTIMSLVIIGGLGFIVIRDLRRKLIDRRRRLSFHTRLMLTAVPVFIVLGVLCYLLLDETGLFTGLPAGEGVMAAFFQSVTTRTAGFNTVDQTGLSPPARWVTLLFMLIGGGSGSTAGGIKLSTAVILFLVLFRGVDNRGDLRLFRYRLSSVDINRATMFFLKAVALLFLSVLILGVIENPAVTGFTHAEIVFESMSALGTVGLSMGITPRLSLWGKMLIALTMFVGRVGLFSLVIMPAGNRVERLLEFPKGEVLIG